MRVLFRGDLGLPETNNGGLDYEKNISGTGYSVGRIHSDGHCGIPVHLGIHDRIQRPVWTENASKQTNRSVLTR